MTVTVAPSPFLFRKGMVSCFVKSDPLGGGLRQYSADVYGLQRNGVRYHLIHNRDGWHVTVDGAVVEKRPTFEAAKNELDRVIEIEEKAIRRRRPGDSDYHDEIDPRLKPLRWRRYPNSENRLHGPLLWESDGGHFYILRSTDGTRRFVLATEPTTTQPQDLIGTFDTEEQAKQAAFDTMRQWAMSSRFDYTKSLDAVAPKRRYGCLMAVLPPHVAARITEWTKANVLDEHLAEKGRETEPHVTIKYGFEEDGPEVVGRLRALLLRHGPVTLTITGMSLFRGTDNGDVLKLDVASPQLHELHAAVSAEFACVDKFPEYVPHVTLAYLKPGAGDLYAEEPAPVVGEEVTVEVAEFRDAERLGSFVYLTPTAAARDAFEEYMGKPVESFQKSMEDKLAKVVEGFSDIEHERGPDYQHLFYNPETKEVWWEGADGDSGEALKEIQRRLESVDGVSKVTVECEASPSKKPGWIEIKSLHHDDQYHDEIDPRIKPVKWKPQNIQANIGWDDVVAESEDREFFITRHRIDGVYKVNQRGVGKVAGPFSSFREAHLGAIAYIRRLAMSSRFDYTKTMSWQSGPGADLVPPPQQGDRPQGRRFESPFIGRKMQLMTKNRERNRRWTPPTLQRDDYGTPIREGRPVGRKPASTAVAQDKPSRSGGQCKVGERSDLTGCTPASDKPSAPKAPKGQGVKPIANMPVKPSTPKPPTEGRKPVPEAKAKPDHGFTEGTFVGVTKKVKKDAKGKTVEAKLVMADGKPAPEWITPNMISALWRNVQVSRDKNSARWIQYEYTDQKWGAEKTGSVLNPEFVKKNLGKAFAATRDCMTQLPAIVKELQGDLARGGRITENAACLWLVATQGTRPGTDSMDNSRNVHIKHLAGMPVTKKNVVVEKVTSKTGKVSEVMYLKMGDGPNDKVKIQDKGVQEQLRQRIKAGADLFTADFWLMAHGAVTLQARHVVKTKEGVRIQFTGKKQKWNDHLIRDPALAKEILRRAQAAKDPAQKLFATTYGNANGGQGLLEYSRTVGKDGSGGDGGNFTPKIFRKVVATNEAVKIMKTVGAPKTDVDYAQAVLAVGTKVSELLGNEPMMAVEKYIDPTVWGAWSAKLKMTGAKMPANLRKIVSWINKPPKAKKNEDE